MSFFDVVRTTTFFFSFLLVQVLLLAMYPFTFFHPVLRAVGVAEIQLPMYRVFQLSARFILLVSGVRLRIRDDASSIRRSQILFLFNHTSNLDPIILQSAVAAKFVYKKELQKVPLFGWVMRLYHHIAVDRKDKEKAIDSLNRAVLKVVKRQQNVAISPEGTRSITGDLLPFKKGPFHMAMQSNAAIVPVVIRGAYRLLPPKVAFLRPGTVDVHLMPPITIQPGETVENLQERVRNVFVKELEPQVQTAEATSQWFSIVPSLLFWLVLVGLLYDP